MITRKSCFLFFQLHSFCPKSRMGWPKAVRRPRRQCWIREEQLVQEPQPVGPLDCILAIHLKVTIMALVLAITLYKHNVTYAVTYTITESEPQSIT